MSFSPFCQIWRVSLPFPQIKALTIRSLVLQHIQITIIVTIQCVLVCVDKMLLSAVLFNGVWLGEGGLKISHEHYADYEWSFGTDDIPFASLKRFRVAQG